MPPQVTERIRDILAKEYPEMATASPEAVRQKGNEVMLAARPGSDHTPVQKELGGYVRSAQQEQVELKEKALEEVYGDTPRHVENTARLKEIGDAIIEDAVQDIPPTEAENIFSEYDNPDDKESAQACARRQEEATGGSSPASREALALLKRVGNVLEIGAYNGYMAHEAKRSGVDIIATDRAPANPEGDGAVKYPQPYAHLVRKMDLVEATRAYPDRNLLALYLPHQETIHDLNENFRGRYLMAAGYVDEQNRFEDHWKGRLRNYAITAVVPMAVCGLKPDAQPGGVALALYERKDLLNQAGDGAVTTLLPNAGRDRFPTEGERLGYADPERNDSPSERLRRGDRRRQPDYKRNRRNESDLDSFEPLRAGDRVRRVVAVRDRETLPAPRGTQIIPSSRNPAGARPWVNAGRAPERRRTAALQTSERGASDDRLQSWRENPGAGEKP